MVLVMNSESFLWHDFAGVIGAVMILGAYLFLQFEKLKANSLEYSMANFIGALLIILSLVYRFNLPAFIVELSWAVISGVGLYKYVVQYFKRKNEGV